MRQVHCDGCGHTEPDGLAKKNQKILSVSIRVEKDPRFPEGTDKYDADLCPTCRGLLLHTYFNVSMPERLELDVPSFLGVEELTDQEMHSVKVDP
jgi:hypothetical protein